MTTAILDDDAWVRRMDSASLAPHLTLPGRWKHFVLPTTKNLGMIVGLGELAPGERMPPQANAVPQTSCILAGGGRVAWQATGGECSADLETGHACFMPRHVRHDIGNIGTKPLRILLFQIEATPPAGADSPAAGETPFVKTMHPADLVPISGINGGWKRYVLPSAANAGMVVALGELPPHTRMSWHAHPEPEVFTVISGNGRAYWRMDSRECAAEMQSGAAFYKIGAIPHDMECTGDEPLVGIAFKIQLSR